VARRSVEVLAARQREAGEYLDSEYPPPCEDVNCTNANAELTANAGLNHVAAITAWQRVVAAVTSARGARCALLRWLWVWCEKVCVQRVFVQRACVQQVCVQRVCVQRVCIQRVKVCSTFKP
jgi:hypothetical protein